MRFVAARSAEGSGQGTATVVLVLAHGLGVLGAAAVAAYGYAWPGADAFLAAWPDWCALGTWATVVSVGHVAVINGRQQVRAYTLVNLAGGLLATLVTVLGVWRWRAGAVGLAAAAVPVSTALVAMVLTRGAAWPGQWWWREARPLLRMGAGVMASAAVGAAMPYLARRIVGAAHPPESLGYFNAVWQVSQLYIGFLLSALAADYFPRLSALSFNAAAQTRMAVSEALLVLRAALPFVLVAIVLAPLVVQVLYTAEFAAAVPMLRWQMVGDSLKVGGWALGFLLLARQETRAYLLGEVLWAALYLGLLYVTIPTMKLEVAGMAYSVAYAVYVLYYLAQIRRNVAAAQVRQLGATAASAAALAAAMVMLVQGGTYVTWALAGLVLVATTVYTARKLEVKALVSRLRHRKK